MFQCWFRYRVNTGDFNQGIGCLVRGNTKCFRENMISCTVLDPLHSEVVLAENEELVSHIIDIQGDSELEVIHRKASFLRVNKISIF